jgi:hypothetical protein
MFRFIGLLVFGSMATSHALAQIQLPTVDEALEISSKTGRPIFAMAGQQT